MAVQEEDDPERRREEEFHSHSRSLTSVLVVVGRDGYEEKASNVQLSSVIFPFTFRREPVCGVELKEMKTVCVMERERLEGTSMNVVKGDSHSVKLNVSVLIALSRERDMTEEVESSL